MRYNDKIIMISFKEQGPCCKNFIRKIVKKKFRNGKILQMSEILYEEILMLDTGTEFDIICYYLTHEKLLQRPYAQGRISQPNMSYM